MKKTSAGVQKFSIRAKPAGEPFVWFTSLGLAIGILMIIFLLGLITTKGLDVFWPKRVAHIELKENAPSGIAGSRHLAGIITKEREMAGVATCESTNQEVCRREIQVFLGNKDAYGLMFRFVNQSDIQSVLFPRDIMKIERLEYGDAIGVPLELLLEGGDTLAASDPRFEPALERLVREADRRWAEIRLIERSKIGQINNRMTALRQRRQAIERAGGSDTNGKIDEITAEQTKLQTEYEMLAAESRVLRAEQKKAALRYRLATGRDMSVLAGEIVGFYYPNRLGFWERLKLFFKNIVGFLTHDPREANTEGGVFPAIFGTFVMTVLMSIAVMPVGVLAAIYLREYAKQGFLVRAVRIAVNNLAGVPSIVFGVFGVGFFIYFVGGGLDRIFFKDALPTPTYGTGGILWASLTLALLTVPVVIVATEEALAAVPRGMREGSLACGASKWQTIQRIVLPASAPGILTGLILAMARGAGEVAPLMITGAVKLAPNLPVDAIPPFVHLNRKFMHLGFHIYDLGFQSPDSEAAIPMVFATTLLLIVLVVTLNLSAIIIREKLRKKYAIGAF